MSRLLQQSPAIGQWFLELSRPFRADAAFLDLEAQGIDFFCRNGQAISASLDDEGHFRSALQQNFCP